MLLDLQPFLAFVKVMYIANIVFMCATHSFRIHEYTNTSENSAEIRYAKEIEYKINKAPEKVPLGCG